MTASPTTQPIPQPSDLRLDRRRLLAALRQAQAIVPSRTAKPILTGVRLHAADGKLHLAASDGDIAFHADLDAEGVLPAGVVPGAEFLRRVKAATAPTCTLTLRPRPARLIFNGGRVRHALTTLPLDDFPPVVTEPPKAPSLAIPAGELRAALAMVTGAMSRERFRYAVNGVLLEVDADGARLVAADGRRLAKAELPQAQGDFTGTVILPGRLATLIQRFAADGADAAVTILVQTKTTDEGEKLPSDLYVSHGNWRLSCAAVDGRFPEYRTVVPQSASRFAVERQVFAAVLQEVMAAAGVDADGVTVTLRPRGIELSAQAPETGSATAKVPARFLGGGDGVIHTAFNPRFLLEAVNTLTGERIVFDLEQNVVAADGRVTGRPVMLYADGRPQVSWLVMPVHRDWPPTREYLGHNYREPLAATG